MRIRQTEITNALLGTALCVAIALGLTFSFRNSSIKSIMPILSLVVNRGCDNEVRDFCRSAGHSVLHPDFRNALVSAVEQPRCAEA